MSPPAPSESQRAVVEKFSGAAKEHSVVDFLLNIVPDNVFGAFVHGDVLQIMFFAVLFGAAVLSMGEKGRKIEETIDRLSAALFGVIAIVIRYAPIAAFSAMAFTVGAFGLSSLGSLALLVLSTYAAMAFFIFVVLGLVARFYGFSLLRFLAYIKEEILIMLSTSNSESVLPRLMEKMQKLGCSKSVVALVLPTGYTLNQDGTSIYLSLSTLFIAQAYGMIFRDATGRPRRHHDDHVERCGRGLRRRLRDPRLDAGRDRNAACRGARSPSRRGALYVDGTRSHQHDRKRGRHGGRREKRGRIG
jgi:aerobic C4-dicarboxylate transport protein